MQERHLTPEQLAEILGVNIHTLARRRVTGIGSAFKKLENRFIRYRESVVQAWIDQYSD